MNMSEFDTNPSSERDDQYFLYTQGYPLPADFGEEERAFVEEFWDLFVPEELSPYYEPTLSAPEDTRYYSVEPGFEQKTSACVFQRLKLRRRRRTPRLVLNSLNYSISSISARLSLLASAAAFVLILLCLPHLHRHIVAA